MDILINKFSEWLDDGEYRKILDICQLIFNLTAPSFSYIFLYERNIFKEMDIIRFIILCVILNSILLCITWIIMMSRNNLKNSLKPEEERVSKKHLILESNISTQIFVNLITPLIWIMYINYIVYGNKDLLWVSNCTSLCVIGLFSISIIEIIINLIKLKKYNDIVFITIYVFILGNIVYNILT